MPAALDCVMAFCTSHMWGQKSVADKGLRMQEALTQHSSAPLAADSMAGLASAADTTAAVAAAGMRADQRGHMLSIDACERPALECLRVLCGQVCSAAAAGGDEAAVEASARCLCSVLRMCAELRYQIDDKVISVCKLVCVLCLWQLMLTLGFLRKHICRYMACIRRP